MGWSIREREAGGGGESRQAEDEMEKTTLTVYPMILVKENEMK